MKHYQLIGTGPEGNERDRDQCSELDATEQPRGRHHPEVVQAQWGTREMRETCAAQAVAVGRTTGEILRGKQGGREMRLSFHMRLYVKGGVVLRTGEMGHDQKSQKID
jgi:hypothetical protein